ncbi:hypothetical protein [Angelakisella massiliensis]|uniref:hypothetical protein n=1 Tax=Angelakisella massiliensis TaxID=1871018 RepID=UPI0008F8294F|nr:hypothetical protein [Angelakisella massiliensis]
MERIMILNGSPRASKSNSRRYGAMVSACCKGKAEYFAITRQNHRQLAEQMERFSHVVLVFPLYADGIPVTLLNFFKTLEEYPPENKPVISVLINCGFLEYQQNDIAVEMVRFFCRENHYPFGSVLKIGSGEAILDTPFRFLVSGSIRKFSRSIMAQKYRTFHVSMPLTKKLFVKASTSYWTEYGRKNGITVEQMQTMEIEG